jgi:ABC-type dipeptide/oligopeptide/nickel transport system permease subunit
MLLQIKSFKNMMRKILKNKKSLIGVIILTFFTIIATIGPLFTTLDPISSGSVPPGEMPVATSFCYPEWYRDFTGNEEYTKNIYVNPDPGFSDLSKLSLWKNVTTEGVHVNYNSDYGLSEKGCLEITFTKEGNATISIDFEYPYTVPPKMFAAKWSYKIESQGLVSKDQATLLVLINFTFETPRGPKTYLASMPYLIKDLTSMANWLSRAWHETSSTNPNLFLKYGKDPSSVIFSKPREYSFDIFVQLAGNTTGLEKLKFLMDDVKVVIYGNSFGLLGTDQLARDIFTQLIIGTQISFFIGLIASLLGVGIGLLVGLIAGYLGGTTDEVLMRFTDMLLVIPTLPLLLVLVFVLGQTMMNIILVVGLLGWMGFARTVRSAVLSLKERSFIEAVRALGGGRTYIIRRHIIPNVFPLIYVTLAMSVPSAIVSEAALSWLGLGPADVMSWGRILYEFERSGSVALGALQFWYWVIPPGLGIALLSLSFVLIGYALDEILNPRLRER